MKGRIDLTDNLSIYHTEEGIYMLAGPRYEICDVERCPRVTWEDLDQFATMLYDLKMMHKRIGDRTEFNKDRDKYNDGVKARSVEGVPEL